MTLKMAVLAPMPSAERQQGDEDEGGLPTERPCRVGESRDPVGHAGEYSRDEGLGIRD